MRKEWPRIKIKIAAMNLTSVFVKILSNCTRLKSLFTFRRILKYRLVHVNHLFHSHSCDCLHTDTGPRHKEANCDESDLRKIFCVSTDTTQVNSAFRAR